MTDRYDGLFEAVVGRLWPGIPGGWLALKAQAMAESALQERAVSKCGALGLMQLMPATDLAIDGDLDGFDPAGNVDNGLRYLKEQFEHLDEIPNPWERLKFAWAAYNGGRGYVNAALRLAARSEGCEVIKQHPRHWPPGRWQTWDTTSTFLAAGGCTVRGKRPDWRQMIGYVEHILAFYEDLKREKGYSAAKPLTHSS